MKNERAPERPALREQLRAAWKRLRGGALSPGRAAASIAVGLFVGCTPLYGAHAFIVLAICVPLRLDTAVAYLAAHVSNPITGPVVYALEAQIGSVILTGHGAEMSLAAAKSLGVLGLAARLACGATVVAPVTALLGAVTTWFVALGVQDAREPARAEARRRTLSRYARAPRAVRAYVGSKLRADPALDSITALIGSFGRVVDAGCGFGHVGLSLLDRGRATALVGIDVDPARVEVAKQAAGSSAAFELRDLHHAELPEADTILFIDCLHYLPQQDQDAVLARAASALAPGGRVVIRDVALSDSLRSGLTEWLERRAARRHGHRDTLIFRDPMDLVNVLEAAGLTCSGPQLESSNLLDNALVVGQRPRPGDPRGTPA